jgi:hypothetical protein
MSDRIRFIVHKGKHVLLVDLSNCSAAQVDEICHMVPRFVTAQPKGSVLILGDFTGAKFDKKAFTALKEGTVFDRPHIKRSAWVGTESLPKVFYQNVKSFSQRDLPTFKTREEALEWLVKD